MDSESRISEDTLQFIKHCVMERRVLWTYHGNMRMGERAITRSLILDSVEGYEIIESYPEDRYLPSYLIYAEYGKTVLHVVFAIDLEGDNVRVVTAYHPTLDLWRDDLKTRRET